MKRQPCHEDRGESYRLRKSMKEDRSVNKALISPMIPISLARHSSVCVFRCFGRCLCMSACMRAGVCLHVSSSVPLPWHTLHTAAYHACRVENGKVRIRDSLYIYV